jgi:hypothetical protein
MQKQRQSTTVRTVSAHVIRSQSRETGKQFWVEDKGYYTFVVRYDPELDTRPIFKPLVSDLHYAKLTGKDLQTTER